MKSDLIPYKYNGARVLVLLHEKHLSDCLRVWHQAQLAEIKLPKTEDQDYQSLDTLLRHILRAARGYMTWMCEKLELPDPGIEPTPAVELVAAQADKHLIQLLEKWRLPLVDIPEERFHAPVYPSRWGVDYCIDAMLEHAVMHPIRHGFQLMNLLVR